MPLMIYNRKLLVAGSKLAAARACCCVEEGDDCAIDCPNCAATISCEIRVLDGSETILPFPDGLVRDGCTWVTPGGELTYGTWHYSANVFCIARKWYAQAQITHGGDFGQYLTPGDANTAGCPPAMDYECADQYLSVGPAQLVIGGA